MLLPVSYTQSHRPIFICPPAPPPTPPQSARLNSDDYSTKTVRTKLKMGYTTAMVLILVAFSDIVVSAAGRRGARQTIPNQPMRSCRCETICPPIQVVPSGTTAGASCAGGEASSLLTCQYSCEAGYELTDSSNITCSSEGIWPPAPTCQDINDCTDDICKNGGSCTDTGTNSFACQCAAGYSGETCGTNTVDCPDGITCNGQGSCVDLVGGYRCDCDLNRDGVSGWTGLDCETNIDECATATDSCDDNAECTDTDGDYTCQCVDGFTNNGDGVCQENRCPSIRVAPSGTTAGASCKGSSTCQYSCEAGYELTTSATITCNSDGTWPPAPPCQVTLCDPITVTASGTTAGASCAGGEASSLQTCQYSCGAGYELTDSSNITCSSEGIWQPAPTCQAITQGLTMMVNMDLNLTRLDDNDTAILLEELMQVAAGAGGFDLAYIETVELVQLVQDADDNANGGRQRRQDNGPLSFTAFFKEEDQGNVLSAIRTMNEAIDQGNVYVVVELNGRAVEAQVTERVTIINECTCAGGVAATASDKMCDVHGQEKCMECHAGYTLTGLFCSAHVCTCDGGSAAVAYDGSCETGGAEICTDCNAGYAFHAETATCECDAGFTLVGQACEENICSCHRGSAAVSFDGSCSINGDEHCTSCEIGFRLEGKLCIANTCTCDGGTEVRVTSEFS